MDIGVYFRSGHDSNTKIVRFECPLCKFIMLAKFYTLVCLRGGFRQFWQAPHGLGLGLMPVFCAIIAFAKGWKGQKAPKSSFKCSRILGFQLSKWHAKAENRR